MLKSMTAFARMEQNHALGSFVWEIRSINHRYLEMNFRLIEELRSAEFEFRKKIQSHLNRGKLDCTFRLRATTDTDVDLAINTQLLDSLLKQAQIIQQQLPKAEALDPLALLAWPGVAEQSKVDQAELVKAATELLDGCVASLVDNRKVEGMRMQEVIAQRCVQLKDLVEKVRVRRPEVLAAIRKKMMSRIEDLNVEADSGRLEQEIVIISQKLDVDEEMDRLDSHLQEIDSVLNKNQPAGRRLDFLIQELNREANTLSSKSADIITTQAAVDMKVLIEQMREQVQNIE